MDKITITVQASNAPSSAIQLPRKWDFEHYCYGWRDISISLKLNDVCCCGTIYYKLKHSLLVKEDRFIILRKPLKPTRLREPRKDSKSFSVSFYNLEVFAIEGISILYPGESWAGSSRVVGLSAVNNSLVDFMVS